MNTTILTSKDYVADNIKFPVWTGFHPGKVAEAYSLNFDEYANIDKKFIDKYGDESYQKSQETCQNEHRSIEHKRKHKGINNGNKHQEKRPQTNNQLQKSQETC
ncbi:11608_t:CDS:2 [Entrophospora sp. SA101]|nr:11608_t:CDS:2 [Entrophospora sp. SA101]